MESLPGKAMFDLTDLPDLERGGRIGEVQRNVPVRSGIPSTQAVDQNRYMSQNSFDRQAKLLEVFITNECPVKCAHCLVHSGGLMRGDTPRRILRRIIETASADPCVEIILFLGGEPFAALDSLHYALQLTKQLGLKSGVLTSGNWAVSPEEARRIFTPLAPLLDNYFISMDYYHQIKIPLAHVRNAIQAALDESVEPAILTNMTAAQYRQRAGQLLVPPDVLEIADEFGIAFQCWPLMDVGRATNFKKQIPRQRADQPCGFLNRFSFFPNGDVHGCGCGIEKFKPGDPVYLGNMETATVTDVVCKASRSLTIQGIRALGPVKLLQLIGEKTDGFLTQCTACAYLNKCRDVEQRVTGALVQRPDLIEYITRFRRKSEDLFPQDHCAQAQHALETMDDGMNID